MSGHPSLVTGLHETLCNVANSGSDELPECSLYTFLCFCFHVYPFSFLIPTHPSQVHFQSLNLLALSFAAYVAVPFSVFSSG